MAENNRRVCIVGIGTTASPGTHHPYQTWKEQAADAAYEALADAGLPARELDAAVAAYHGEGVSEQGGYGAAMADALGIAPIPVYAIVANCCGGSVAFINGFNLIQSGQHDKVLVIGGDKDGDNIGYTENINISFDTEYDFTFGFRHRDGVEVMTDYYKEHFGYKDYEFFGALAYQTHKFARKNPKASAYGMPLPPRESFNHSGALYSMMGEGQAACVLMCEEEALKYTDKPIYVTGVGYATDSHYSGHRIGEEPMGPMFPEYLERSQSVGFGATAWVATDMAYKMAGITPDQVDVAQVYDLSSVTYFLAEALRLCPLGEAGRCFINGDFDLGGRVPVNTDGGNIARGHASGADGMNQIVENVRQLRGEGYNQVEGATCAASANVGSVYAQCTTVVLTNKDFKPKAK